LAAVAIGAGALLTGVVYNVGAEEGAVQEVSVSSEMPQEPTEQPVLVPVAEESQKPERVERSPEPKPKATKRPSRPKKAKDGCPLSNELKPIKDDPIPSGAKSYRARSTTYYPEDPSGNPVIEGGMSDRKYAGRLKCHSLEDYLQGKSGKQGEGAYVALAMDTNAFPYGTVVRIPELEKMYGDGKAIYCRIVDTGGAFQGKGTKRVDIMVRRAVPHRKLGSLMPLTLKVIKKP
jgi:3D (Asp-Asp-Asp) domain-containing protein